MSRLQFETQVSPEGLITLPPIPELHGHKIVVSVEKIRDRPLEDDWRPDPSAVREFFGSRKPLAEELTEEEIERLKRERRMRKMQ